jgi:hypothetical protein
MNRALVGVSLILLLALPGSRGLLEREMITHMLIQIPLLAMAGVLISSGIPRRWRTRIAAWNRGGISGALLAVIVSSWWMVPRALDSVLSSPGAELWKFLSLPLFVGLPAALSWPALGMIGRGFVVVNVLPMWAVVGWLYVAAPVRVCNYYLIDQQVVAGKGLLWVSVSLAVVLCVLSFRPQLVRLLE